MYAAEQGHEDIATLLLTHTKWDEATIHREVNRRNRDGKTSLMFACSRGHRIVAEMLLSHGANIDISLSKGGGNALMYAVAAGNVQVLRLLLDRGANIYQTDHFGDSALMFAVVDARIEVVRLLIERGGETLVRMRNNVGSTALYEACRRDKLNIASLLISSGGDVFERSESDVGSVIDVNNQSDRGLLGLLAPIDIIKSEASRRMLMEARDKYLRWSARKSLLCLYFGMIDSHAEAPAGQSSSVRTVFNFDLLVCIVKFL